jgi:hypothetical protein
MRAHVDRVAERLVGRAVSAALSPETDDAKAAGIAMRLIEQADPPSQATVEISGAVDLENLSYSELLALAAQYGISLEREDATPPALEAST